MVFQIEATETPIRFNNDGVAYVGETRVLLSSVIWKFQQGERPEAIVGSFPTLSLANVYQVIGYYLQHHQEIDDYIRQEDEEGQQLRQQLQQGRPEMFTAQTRLQQLKRESQQE